MTDHQDNQAQAEVLKQRIREAQTPFAQATICSLIQAEMARKGHPVSLKRLSCLDRFSADQLTLAAEILPTVLGASLPKQTIEEIAVNRRTSSL